MKSTIRLFKAVPIATKKGRIDPDLLKKTIKNGYIFSPEVVHNYSNYDMLMQAVDDIYGINAEKLNSSFHKSWAKVRDTNIEQLIIEQLTHYVTTYGKESPREYMLEKGEQWGVDDLAGKIIELGDFESDKIWDKDYIYIPKEKLEIPDIIGDGVKLAVIKGYTKDELKTKLLGLLSSGIALKEDTVKDALEVFIFLGLDEDDIEGIKNKEAKAALYDYLDIFPKNPIEFLRFAVYKATGKTLLIKSSDLIEEIKEKGNASITMLFVKYAKNHGLERLAEIFYRFKPIFLAFRVDRRLRPMINKIRKLAIKHHKPMPEDYLNAITSKIKKGQPIQENRLMEELSSVNIFRKIRLAYALKFRTKDVESILYKIRNGKGYVADFSFDRKEEAQIILDIITDSIVEDVKKNVMGKKIYIPPFIHYSLPATEKQFTGNFPSGTYVTVPKDIIFGIHWDNINHHTIDLDLSVISPTEGKFGWDADYREKEGKVLFSGDITNAPLPKGATELFYIEGKMRESLMLYVNYYNFEPDIEVPFKIIVAQEEVVNLEKNYTVNPNNLISVAETKINQREKILGLVVAEENGCRFYFVETSTGNSITSSDSEIAEQSRKYLFNFYGNTIDFRDILIQAGAKLVTNIEESDLNLSPDTLEKDSILNLLKGI